MDKFVITGFGEHDGEYEFDAGAFNIREWRWIKKLSGHTDETISGGYLERDPDLLVAFAVIAMCRDGKIGREDGLRVAEEMVEVPIRGAKLLLVAEEVDIPLEESTPTRNGQSTSSQSSRLLPTGPLQPPSGPSSTILSAR